MGRAAVKIGALDHPKTLDFASRLGVRRAQAIGHLELMWAFTALKAPHGNIGKWPDGAIAMACDWDGDAAAFVAALADAGFLERDPEYRLLVHDWHEHAPRWVRSKITRAGEMFHVKQSHTPDLLADNSPDSSGDCSRDSSIESVRHATPRHGKKSVLDSDESSRPESGSLNGLKPIRHRGPRGKSKGTLKDQSLDWFFEFWDAFAHKHGRMEAIGAWLELEKAGEITQATVAKKIIPAARAEAARRQKLRPDQTPIMAQGWLTGRRFDDEGLVGEDPERARIARERAESATRRDRAAQLRGTAIMAGVDPRDTNVRDGEPFDDYCERVNGLIAKARMEGMK